MVRRKRFSIFSFQLCLIWLTGYCHITERPVDTEVLLGHRTYFNCSTSNPVNEISWYHLPVGDQRNDNRYVYVDKQIFSPYDKRHRIDINKKTGSINLIINDVQWNDSGLYTCQNDDGDGHPAQLIVLNSIPVCETNIRISGFIGPNTCELQKDFVQVSCVANYRGNIPPELKWKLIQRNNTIVHLPDAFSQCTNDSAKFKSTNDFAEIRCNLKLESNSYVDGSKLVWETSRSRNSVTYYTSEIIRVQYAFSTSQQVDAYIGDDVTCSVNTNSDFCKYAWNWVDGVSQKTISGNEHLMINISGWHRCEADCTIKGTHCRFHAMLVNAKEEKSANTNAWAAVAIALTVFISIVAIAGVIIGLIFWRKRHAADNAKSHELEMNIPGEDQILKDNEEVMRGLMEIVLRNASHSTTTAGLNRERGWSQASFSCPRESDIDSDYDGSTALRCAKIELAAEEVLESEIGN